MFNRSPRSTPSSQACLTHCCRITSKAKTYLGMTLCSTPRAGHPSQNGFMNTASKSHSATQLPTKRPFTLGPIPFPTGNPTIITNGPTEAPIRTSSPTSNEPTSETPTISTPELLKTITVQASKDSYIDSSLPDDNFGSSNRLRVDASPELWSVITFDISKAIIENFSITEIQRQRQIARIPSLRQLRQR